MNNGYKYAELAIGESLGSPTVCDHCGKEELKRTIKLINPAGRVVWFGVGCAANAMGLGLKEVRRAKAAQDSDLSSRERAIADAKREAQFKLDQIEGDKWAAWCAANAIRPEGIIDFDWNLYTQIKALGGYKAARAAYLAAMGSK